MKLKSTFLFLMSLFLFFSCTSDSFIASDKTKYAPSNLSYPTTGEAREGKEIISSLPSINTNGYQPSFRIESIRSETDLNKNLSSQFFIDETSGVISIPEGNTLLGEHSYQVDIWVATVGDSINVSYQDTINEGTDSMRIVTLNKRTYTKGDSTLFNDGYSVNILKALIEGLGYPVSKEIFVRGRDTTSREPEFIGNTEDLIFYLEETTGSEHFTINNATGVISMSAEATPEIGNYALTVSANNVADSLMIFEEALTINIVSKPYQLIYTPNIEANVQEGAPRTTQYPTPIATSPSLVSYRLASNTPKHFTINTSTGAVTLNVNHPYLSGDTIYVSVYAKNQYGESYFENTVGFSIVEPNNDPLSEFRYSDNGQQAIMQSLAFQSNVPAIEGGYPITFSIIAGNETGEFTIDAQSGIISLSKGNNLETGDYTLNILAENASDTITTSYGLSIVPLVKDVIFDSDFTASGAITNGATGNMLTKDLDNNADFSAKKKAWYGKSSIWSKLDNKKRAGIQLLPQKSMNNDWAYAENVDLTNKNNAELFLEWYQLYGAGRDDISRYTIQVSEDFDGDVTTATWEEVVFLNEIFDHKDELLGSGYDVTPEYVDHDVIDLSKYDGKVITIAIHGLLDHTLNPIRTENDLTRATYVTEFVIKALDN